MGAPRRASSATTTVRVCDPMGNSTQGPQPDGTPMLVPGGPYTESCSTMSDSMATPGTSTGGSTHTTRSRSPDCSNSISGADGASAEAQLDIGVIGAKSAEHVGVVADRCGIDHAEAEASGPPCVDPIGPIAEVAGEGEYL